ncbi:replicative DNA helicase [Eubacteriales bacterium OttesenSCG-928-N13]|nr:replicative DNA helicase [Eubacteriales bacterium OttesenSCG-928-N13]
MEQRMPGDRIPPHHLDAERSVLGSMLLANEAVLLAQELLTEDEFYEPAHREIFSAMLRLVTQSRPVDLVTLEEELSRRGTLQGVGGLAYLMDISRRVPSAANVTAYIQIVDEKSTLRKLINASGEIGQMSYTQDQDVKDILSTSEKLIYDISMRKGGEMLKPIQPILLDTYDRIDRLVKNKGKIEGVPTGYKELDDLTTGLHGGELVLVAARPSMGKTSLGMNIVENASIRAGIKSAIFSLEMPAEQLVMRMMCTEAQVDMHNVRRGVLSEDEWMRLCESMGVIGHSSIHIDATPGITVPEIRSKARRLQMESGLDLVMIDYIQLMSGAGKFGSRQEEVSSISRSLKGLAQELNVPVVALSQLSRAATGRADHRPVLSDIRESGAIEQDADVVMFIHRDDYYNPEKAEQEGTRNIAEIIIAKQRNGSLGSVKLGWRGELTKFLDMSAAGKESYR